MLISGGGHGNIETMDALEDWAGWSHETIALVRVMLTSLITRITTQSKVCDPL
jgi:hypothetical protein